MYIGDLVESTDFIGIGKVVELKPNTEEAILAFFESPLKPRTNQISVKINMLRPVTLAKERIVYCQDPETKIWGRARYIGERPAERRHLISFRQGNDIEISIEDLYCANLSHKTPLNPAEFLAAKSNDAPFFFPLREAFVSSYISQRAACRSMSSLSSSSVELEQHQLAVVRRVLQDSEPKYLLADEVGLGKTIEAGLIIREHILEKKEKAAVLIAVPENLIDQWRNELTDRFFLGVLINNEDSDDNPNQIIICSYKHASFIVEEGWQPTLLLIDEAHQVSDFAWSQNQIEKQIYKSFAKCAHNADVSLLLSGTPLNGNEKNFLAMLHCLSPKAYPLNAEGIHNFFERVKERERLGGLYGAIAPDTSNASLEGILSELAQLFPSDECLMDMIEKLGPLVDFFAPDEGPDRDEQIIELRRYIGENYRLHHRLLRNRRENSDLEILFPGLGGLNKYHWTLNATDLTLDELLDDYRNQVMTDPDYFKVMSRDNYLQWIDDALISPINVKLRAKKALNETNVNIPEPEREILLQIVKTATEEQERKDQLLGQVLNSWLTDNPDGKAVVFCSQESLSHHLVKRLKEQLLFEVIGNSAPAVRSFNSSENQVRVLVCDQRGEDGLNFNGGRRLALHYSLPRDISRIEQRLGRFNRYSANLINVKPVESAVLISDRIELTALWVELLDDVMQVFNRTLASLQYMLEEQLAEIWKKYFQEGYNIFNQASEILSGDTGLISKEFKRVKAQEELMSLEEEVEEAFEFAEGLEEADEIAEEQVRHMTGWIKKALNFQQTGRPGEGFRFRFILNNGPPTLVDVHSFISNCMLSLDFEGGYPPTTMPMSASRTEVVNGKGLYPLRYGQPFVDAIWDLMQEDSRGTSMAFLRIVNGHSYNEPEIFFRFSWLLCAHPYHANRVEQRIADEKFLPQIKTIWVRQDGGEPSEEELETVSSPYKSYGYTDLNLRSSLWSLVEDWFPSDLWQRTVLDITEKSLQMSTASYSDIDVDLHTRLLSAQAVILCNNNLLSYIEDQVNARTME